MSALPPNDAVCVINKCLDILTRVLFNSTSIIICIPLWHPSIARFERGTQALLTLRHSFERHIVRWDRVSAAIDGVLYRRTLDQNQLMATQTFYPIMIAPLSTQTRRRHHLSLLLFKKWQTRTIRTISAVIPSRLDDPYFGNVTPPFCNAIHSLQSVISTYQSRHEWIPHLFERSFVDLLHRHSPFRTHQTRWPQRLYRDQNLAIRSNNRQIVVCVGHGL